MKVMQTESHGARVVLHGEHSTTPMPMRCELEAEQGLTFVHPFDDPQIIAGEGTVALEMLADAPELDTLCVPIGGGGLISGMATAAKALDPDIELVGVQAELYPSMKNVVEGGELPFGGDTLGRRHCGQGAGPADLGRSSRIWSTTSCWSPSATSSSGGDAGRDREDRRRRRRRRRARGAARPIPSASPGARSAWCCAAAISTRVCSPTCCSATWSAAGRIARLRIELQDRPGALAAITAKFDEHGVNIIEVNHHRIFTRLPAKGTVTDVECEARDAQAIDTLVSRLEAAHFTVERAQLD